MSAPRPLADCCPECDPFDSSPSLPLDVQPDTGDSLRASYKCGQGHSWVTWWDRAAAEWPVIQRGAA